MIYQYLHEFLGQWLVEPLLVHLAQLAVGYIPIDERVDPLDEILLTEPDGNPVILPADVEFDVVFVGPGDLVEKGARLAIVEAMKMEHTLLAPLAGTIGEIVVQPGAQVQKAAILMIIAPAAA